MQEDEEAEAVQEYAQREADLAEARRLEQEDPGFLAGLEEDAEEKGQAEPVSLAQPITPNEAQIEATASHTFLFNHGVKSA